MFPADGMNELFDGLAQMASNITGREKPSLIKFIDGNVIDAAEFKYNFDQINGLWEEPAYVKKH